MGEVLSGPEAMPNARPSDAELGGREDEARELARIISAGTRLARGRGDGVFYDHTDGKPLSPQQEYPD